MLSALKRLTKSSTISNLSERKYNMKCDNCGKYKAKYKDYRTDEQDNINKTYNCQYCNVVNDVLYYRIRRDKLDPKTLVNKLEGLCKAKRGG